eukprot:gene8451-9317_t
MNCLLLLSLVLLLHCLVLVSSFRALPSQSFLRAVAPSTTATAYPHTSSSSSSSSSLAYKNFDEFLESMEQPVLVDFYAQWCGPCRMLQPVLEDVANRLENVAKVAKVDTDKSPRLGSKYDVEALPTLILFYKGRVLQRFVGYRTADVLEREVREALAALDKA